MTALSALWLLAAAAFLSATLLPGSSEAVMIGLLTAGAGTGMQPVAAATFVNMPGAAVNWLIGRFLARYERRGWFPARSIPAASVKGSPTTGTQVKSSNHTP